ncbi:MAG: nucleotidyl transferase AbiEii/AbiGii toxin family protein [Candidatus Aminicenantes bacterium]|jgi:predicted nucleotidyltransferase component of viral defense system
MSEKPYKQYYKELYVIQDAVFKIVEAYDFYLTGGTALSRFYLNHRYWDDLDFFVHQKEAIEELMVFDLLKTFPAHMFKQIRWTKPIKTEDFEKERQIMLEDLITKSPNSLVNE